MGLTFLSAGRRSGRGKCHYTVSEQAATAAPDSRSIDPSRRLSPAGLPTPQEPPNVLAVELLHAPPHPPRRRGPRERRAPTTHPAPARHGRRPTDPLRGGARHPLRRRAAAGGPRRRLPRLLLPPRKRARHVARSVRLDRFGGRGPAVRGGRPRRD